MPPPLDMPLPPEAEAAASPPPEPEPDDEPREGPVRLFIGQPRAVEPQAVRPAGFSARNEPLEPPPAPVDDWESRLRWSGLDRSARTVAEDHDGRRERERRERESRPVATGRERSDWDAMAAAPRLPVTPPRAARLSAPEPEPEPVERTPPPLEDEAPPEPVAPARTSEASALERRLTRGAAVRHAEREAVAAQPPGLVSRAVEDSFFEPPVDPSEPPVAPAADPAAAPRRGPARRLTPGFAEDAGRGNAGRFVPRNQREARPDRPIPAWVWAAAGLLILGAGAAGLYWRVRDQVAPDFAPVSAAELAPSTAAPVAPTAPLQSAAAAPVAGANPTEAPEPATPAAADTEASAAPDSPPAAPVQAPSPPATPPAAPDPARPSAPAATAPATPAADAPYVAIGRIRIVTNQPARVKIDGRAYGSVSATEDYDLPVGEHTVQLTPVRGGRSQSYATRVDEGRATQLKYEFK